MAYIGTSPSNGVRRIHTYTATAGQEIFTGSSTEGVTLTYADTNYIDVFQNGVLLGSADYTSTSGTSVVLAQGASVSDLVVIVVYDVFSVADTVSKTSGGSFDSAVTMSNNLTVSGDLASSTSGTNNFVAGVNAGNSIVSGGNDNTCVGDEAGTAITTGDNSVAIGYRAGDASTTGSSNIAIGRDALGSDVAGNKSIAIGAGALETQNFSSSTDSHNIAIGNNAGIDLTVGERNILVGGLAGEEITDADDIIAIGYRSGGGGAAAATTGHDNVCVGTDAGKVLTSGNSNTIIGRTSGNSITTGTGNICLGVESGSVGTPLTTGTNNIYIGNGISSGSATGTQRIAIGHSIAPIGDNYITVGKGTSGDRVYNAFTANASWTRHSDERLKKDIQNNTDCGLNFINDLRPVTFKFKSYSEVDQNLSCYDANATEVDYPNKMYGLIAQEVKQAMEDNNITDFGGWDCVEENGLQGIAQEMFVHPLIKAVQELSAQVTALETENQTQATQIADLISRITALESGE